MYKQIDGPTMGSPLGLALAYILWGFMKKVSYPVQISRLIIFVMLTIPIVLLIMRLKRTCFFFLFFFFVDSIKIHPVHRFILDKETDFKLPFLDVFARRIRLRYITSIYRKPRFTSHYTRWDSFTPSNKTLI